MPDNTLKIGAEVNLLDLNSRMAEGAETVRASIDKMLISFQEASTGSARAVTKIAEDTRAGAVTVSNEWTRVAQSTLVYNAALKEVSAASYLARKAGDDDASAMLLLASAKQKAAIASRELAAAEKAVAVAQNEEVESSGLFAGALSKMLGPIIGLEILRRRIDDAANFELRMRNLSLITGISAQSLAGLHSVVAEMGGDFDAISVGLSKMEKAQQLASEGNKQAIVGFQRLGISVQELKSLQPEELFYRVARGFNETGSSAEKNAAAIAIFGRGGRALIPVFTELNDQLEEHVRKAGKISGVTNENIEAAQRYKIAMEQVEVITRSFVANAIGPLLGTFNFIGAVLESLGAAVLGLLESIGAFALTIIHSLVGVAKVAYDISTSNFGAAAGDAADAAGKIKGEWTGLASDIKKTWKDVTPALFHPMKDLANLGSLPQLPQGGGGEDVPGTGGADQRLATWKLELQQKRDAEDAFHQLSKSEEASFWESKLAIAQGDSRLYAQVYHELRQAEREGIKESLKDDISATQERVAATKSGSIQRVIILNEEVAYLRALGAEQTEEFKRLNIELVAATRSYAEEQAKIAVQADREKVQSTRRASDERVAAEKTVLDHLKTMGLEGTAEYTAQLRRVTESELAAHNEKLKLQELDIEQEKIVATSIIEVRRQQIQTDFDLHRINGQQRIALLRDLGQQEYEIQSSALEKKLKLLEKDPTISPVELKRIHNEIENLKREHENRMAQIDTQAAKESQKKYDQVFSRINSGFTSAINGMLAGHQSFLQGLTSMWNSAVESIVDKIALIGMKWFEQHVIMRAISALFHIQQQGDEAAAQSLKVTQNAASNLTMGMSDAALAAAGTFAYYSSFAPEVAPAMAAAAYGEGIAWASLASFHAGGISDTEQLAVLKRNEMVLDPALSSGFQKMLGSGGASSTSTSTGSRHSWFGDINVSGSGDPESIANNVFNQVTTFFRTGGVHRR